MIYLNQNNFEGFKKFKFLNVMQIAAYKAQGKQPPAGLVQKIKSHEQNMMAIQNRLKQGGKQAVTGINLFINLFVYI